MTLLEDQEGLNLPPVEQRIAEFTPPDPYQAPFPGTKVNRRDCWGLSNYIGEESEAVLHGTTDSATLADSNRELVTDHMVGCLVVFIRGPLGKCLMHLSPSSKLGYSIPGEKVGTREITFNHLEKTMRIMKPELEKLGPASELDLTLLDNFCGNPRPEMENVANAFQGLGVRSVKKVILPMDETLVAFLPQKPDSLLVMGKEIYYLPDQKDYLVQRKKSLRVEWLPLDPSIPVEFEMPEKPTHKDSTAQEWTY